MCRFMAAAAVFATVAAGIMAASATTLPKADIALLAGTSGASVVLANGRRCTPSRCGCKGNTTTFCTRDCRRDITCGCVRGRYVCRSIKR